MEIKSIITHKNRNFDVIYKEDDPFNDLEGKILQGIHAYCFYSGKLVVVYAHNKGYWTTPGGGIESGESIEEAVVREVKEETNMKVLHQEFIWYQDIYQRDIYGNDQIVRQTRSFCEVEPIGDFVSDPDGDITEIKLIDPKDYKKYFDWGKIGDRLMERSLMLMKKISQNNLIS